MASDFPTKEDVALWDKYDATYGMDEAGSLRRGAPNPTMPAAEIELYETIFDTAKTNEDKQLAAAMLENAIQRLPMDDARREDLMRNFIASRRSGIASLGFKPEKTVMAEKRENLIPGATTMGFALRDYSYSKRDPREAGSTPVHEGMHLGIDQLVKDKDTKSDKLERVNIRAGKKQFDENELAVRALMQKYYGGIEREGQVKSPQDIYDKGTMYLMENMDFINELEQMAAEELRRRGRPMGPR